MALRAATSFIRTSSLLSGPRSLNLRFRHSPSLPLQSRTPNTHYRSENCLCRIRAVHEAASDPITPNKNVEEFSPPNWKIKMLYDGDCPLCMREVNMLRERNKDFGSIKFVDISSEEYSPEENQGLGYETVMGRIHAILSDGTVVTDVEAFRRLYEQVGLGWVYAITKYEPIARLADVIYSIWAKYRLQITGRPPLEEILEARKNSKGAVCRDNKACKT